MQLIKHLKSELMHIFYKTLKYLAFTFLVIVALLFAIAEFAEDHIADVSINQIDKSVGLPVSYGEINFSLLHDFPLATLEINDVWLGSPVSNDNTISKNDTLATSGKIYISVKMLPLVLKQHFDIVEIDVVETKAYYSVTAYGRSNVDFLKDTTHTEHQEVVDTTVSKMNISLKGLNIKNLTFYLNDSSQNIKAQLSIPETSLNGQFINGVFESAIEGSAVLTDCNFSETNVCLMEKTRINFDLAHEKDSVFIEEINILSDGIEAGISGKMGLKDSIYTDLFVEAPKLNIAELIKYIPEETLHEYGIKSLAGQCNLKGTIRGYTTDSLIPHLQFAFQMKNGAAQMEDHLPLSDISLEGTYDNGDACCNLTTTLSINSLKVKTPESHADINILINNLSQPHYKAQIETGLDLNEWHRYYMADSLIKSVNGKLRARFTTEGNLPEKIDSTFIDYLAENSTGSLSFENLNLAVDSALSMDSCHLTLNFARDTLIAENINFQIPAYNVTVEEASMQTSIKGKVSNYTDLAVNINSFHIATPQSKISGKILLSNLHHPDYWLSTTLDANLNELSQMLPDTLNARMSGHLNTRIAMNGKMPLDSLSQKMESHLFENGKYFATLNNVSLEMPDTLMQVNQLSGNLSFANDTLSVSNLHGKYQDIEFGADSTIVTNIYKTFINEKPLPVVAKGKFALGDLKYSQFAALAEDTENTDSLKIKKETTEKPDHKDGELNYRLKGTLSVNSIEYDQSTFKDLSCRFNLSNNLYLIDQLKFKAFNGSLNNSLRYEIRNEEKSVLSLRSEIEKINISTIMEEFNNFDQEEISHEQLSGLFSSQLNGRFLIMGDSLLIDSTRLKGDLKLEDGGLYKYKRAEELAELTNLDELDNIRFKTMESKVFIFNNAIFVPQTDINSNSMNITAYGMQTFGADYQYHLRLYLGEILHGKTRRIRRKQEEMEDNPDDDKSGLRSLYVQASSINGKSRNGLDNKSDRLQMRTKINVQEGILNIVFHPLLVDFNTGVSFQTLSLDKERNQQSNLSVKQNK